MGIELFNSLGQIDIGALDMAAVAELSEGNQGLLKTAIEKIEAREAATERLDRARQRQRDAEQRQTACLERYAAETKPQTPQQAQRAAIAAYNSSH